MNTRHGWLVAALAVGLVAGCSRNRQPPHGFEVGVDGPLESLRGRTQISGPLVISGTSLTDLEPLSRLERTGGIYIFNNHALRSLQGLQALTTVDGDFHLLGNPLVRDLGGLTALTSVSGNLVLDGTGLENVDELSSLQTVTGNLDVRNNPSLTDIRGFSHVRPMRGLLNIYYNPHLPTCAAHRLRDRLQQAGWQGDVLIGGNNAEGSCTQP